MFSTAARLVRRVSFSSRPALSALPYSRSAPWRIGISERSLNVLQSLSTVNLRTKLQHALSKLSFLVKIMILHIFIQKWKARKHAGKKFEYIHIFSLKYHWIITQTHAVGVLLYETQTPNLEWWETSDSSVDGYWQ